MSQDNKKSSSKLPDLTEAYKSLKHNLLFCALPSTKGKSIKPTSTAVKPGGGQDRLWDWHSRWELGPCCEPQPGPGCLSGSDLAFLHQLIGFEGLVLSLDRWASSEVPGICWNEEEVRKEGGRGSLPPVSPPGWEVWHHASLLCCGASRNEPATTTAGS